MDTQLRKDMLALLTPLPSMQTEKGRRALLLSAGLDAILAQTDLSGSPGQAVPLLVNALEQYGTIKTGEPAIVVLLREVATQVGVDKQQVLQEFCDQIIKGQSVSPQDTEQPHPPQPPVVADRDITTQKDYFEHVEGQAQVFTGPVNIYHGVVPQESPVSQSNEQLEAETEARQQPEPLKKEPRQTEPPKKKRLRMKVMLVVGGLILIAIGTVWLYPIFSLIRLRSEPKIVSWNEAPWEFGVDENWQPLEYVENHFDVQGNVVVDRATGLMWQQFGSEKPMNYQAAQQYIQDLNNQPKRSRYTDWRLPTVPELLSLVEPEKQRNGRYINPIFSAHQKWVWSADKRPSKDASEEKAWYIYFQDGTVNLDGIDNNYHVRAVRSIK